MSFNVQINSHADSSSLTVRVDGSWRYAILKLFSKKALGYLRLFKSC